MGGGELYFILIDKTGTYTGGERTIDIVVNIAPNGSLFIKSRY